MGNYLSHSTSAPSTISQHAAIVELRGPQEDMQAMKRAFEKRRDHLVGRMNRIAGVSLHQAAGRVLCDDEHEKLHRQVHVRENDWERGGFRASVPGKRGWWRPCRVRRSRRLRLCPLELRDLAGRDRQGWTGWNSSSKTHNDREKGGRMSSLLHYSSGLEQAVFRERAAGVNLLELEAEMQVNRHILP